MSYTLPRPSFGVTHPDLPSGGVCTSVKRADRTARVVPHFGAPEDERWIPVAELIRDYAWDGKSSWDPEDYAVGRATRPRGRPAKYPWHEWLDGEVHVIEVPAGLNEASFLANLRSRAREVGEPLTTWLPDGRIQLQVRPDPAKTPLTADDLLQAITTAVAEAGNDWPRACELLLDRYRVTRRRLAP